ncbi:RagB/SusD family nutrient uptake outer membrane protein [Mucilaginibacter sp. SMC90]|uniref:RagB/SusD family nutrient uptake outer membrane protein n=1 Tax=Mucilaginibacter sp. SMC90 TaxID=2929803 RepID=UPI001FB3EE09|nr:RagB/SusD family nutrient uptake outer membrane protein [Mucilaginibacter sp. SMC90]UOE52302.1 RagB/SusD family nutrient uptake outer membrane protein [Mucilaginibacter sp. SMC90]
MKKLYFKVLAYSVLGGFMFFTSCKKDGFLGQTQTSNLTEGTVFTDSANTVSFLANIYSNVGFSAAAGRFTYGPVLSPTPNGGLDAASDEAEVSASAGSTALAFETGTINAAVVTDDAYKNCYTNIRSVNQLLKNLPKAPINNFVKTQMKAEARFLRAWYYSILVKHYGGVHLLGDSIYTYTDKIPSARNTYADCVNYILSECDAAGQDLPKVQSGINYGRASKGACLALKSRVLLYAASPLFNGQSIGEGKTLELVGYPSYDKERWRLAEQAAAAVISTGVYSLNVDNATAAGFGFQKLFTKRVNTEYIFQLMRPTGNVDLETLWQPPTRTGKNGAFPLQGLVDAFPMSNGKVITDPASNYNPNDPYANRDPRLNYSIIHDQTPLQIRLSSGTSPINIFVGKYNGNTTGPDAVHVGTTTGYYTNKMLDPAAVANDFMHRTDRCLPLIRYAEVLLNYAEAANEYEGPTGLVYSAVESIRQRAGLNPYQLPAGLTQADMRIAIQNERRIELAFEEHRFWDVRRWKIADQTDNITTKGMEVDRDGATVAYKQFDVRKRNFRKAMYLWPFPQSEVAKSPELIQNPGY